MRMKQLTRSTRYEPIYKYKYTHWNYIQTKSDSFYIHIQIAICCSVSTVSPIPSSSPTIPSLSPSAKPSASPTLAPTSALNGLLFVCYHNAANMYDPDEYVQIMATQIIITFNTVSSSSLWPTSSIKNESLSFCHIFITEFHECPPYDVDSTIQSDYIALATFGISSDSDSNLNKFKQYLIDTMQSDLFQSHFTDNMNNALDDLENSTNLTQTRRLLTTQNFEAIHIEIVDTSTDKVTSFPPETNENVNSDNIFISDTVLYIIISVACALAIIVCILLCICYRKRRNRNRAKSEIEAGFEGRKQAISPSKSAIEMNGHGKEWHQQKKPSEGIFGSTVPIHKTTVSNDTDDDLNIMKDVNVTTETLGRSSLYQPKPARDGYVVNKINENKHSHGQKAGSRPGLGLNYSHSNSHKIPPPANSDNNRKQNEFIPPPPMNQHQHQHQHHHYQNQNQHHHQNQHKPQHQQRQKKFHPSRQQAQQQPNHGYIPGPFPPPPPMNTGLALPNAPTYTDSLDVMQQKYLAEEQRNEKKNKGRASNHSYVPGPVPVPANYRSSLMMIPKDPSTYMDSLDVMQQQFLEEERKEMGYMATLKEDESDDSLDKMQHQMLAEQINQYEDHVTAGR